VPRSDRTARALAAIILVPLIAACSAAPASAPVGTSSASGPGADLPPLTLANVKTETASARGATVGPDGGTIAVTDAKGAAYSLTIPQGALLRTTTIGVYPVSAVSGLPAGASLSAGVQFTPDGLVLQKPGRLTITMPSGANASSLRGIAWSGDGEHGHLYPSLADDANIRLQITHFSGAGVGSPPTPAIVPAVCASPADLDVMLASDAGQPRSAFLRDLRDCYTHMVVPALEAGTRGAETDDSASEATGDLDYVTWQGGITVASEALGDPSFTVNPEVSQSWQLAGTYLVAWYRSWNRQCLADYTTSIAVGIADADSAFGQHVLGDIWEVPTAVSGLDLEATLDGLCLQVVIDPSRSYSASRPGETGTVKVKAGFRFGDEPLRFDPPLEIQVSRTGDQTAFTGRTEGDGVFEQDVEWPRGVDPIQIDILANLVFTDGTVTSIARFDRITKGGHPSRFVFVSTRGNGNPQIWTMADDGTDPRQLTHDVPGRRGDAPAWSPDGKKIAFVSNRDGGEYQLWTMNADGSNQKRLTPGDEINEYPSWSPDGTQIAFMRLEHTTHKTARIALINANGGPISELTAPDGGADFSPSWSPDGSKIAFSSNRSGHGQIYVVDVHTRAVTALTSEAGIAADTNPAWSYDGKRIAFVHQDGRAFSIQVVSPAGFDAVPLYSELTGATFLTWSPDSAKVAFTKLVPATGGGEATMVGAIFVLDVDVAGAVPHPLTPTDSFASEPAWSR
jgi:Tol biopolymer transport system component